MLTAWPRHDYAIVLAIGPHNRTATDVYDLLVTALDLEVADNERTKPPCCDEAGAAPADPDVATVIVDALDALTRRRRGRRRAKRNPRPR